MDGVFTRSQAIPGDIVILSIAIGDGKDVPYPTVRDQSGHHKLAEPDLVFKLMMLDGKFNVDCLVAYYRAKKLSGQVFFDFLLRIGLSVEAAKNYLEEPVRYEILYPSPHE